MLPLQPPARNWQSDGASPFFYTQMYRCTQLHSKTSLIPGPVYTCTLIVQFVLLNSAQAELNSTVNFIGCNFKQALFNCPLWKSVIPLCGIFLQNKKIKKRFCSDVLFNMLFIGEKVQKYITFFTNSKSRQNSGATNAAKAALVFSNYKFLAYILLNSTPTSTQLGLKSTIFRWRLVSVGVGI